MKAIFLFALALLTFQAVAAGTNWAIIVAGSNGYYNYRHQADICHAYQVLHKNGFPDSNIVVMMYDDIANSPSNPYKGNIINKPNGPNVYPGVPKDYTRGEVTPQNFLKALSGEHTGKKVIKSTAEDNIFVYFADHGAAGLIAFPSSYLYANDFMRTLKKMHNNNQYKEMVIYIEACESGSMFSSLLPSNINIYATTASNPSESSWACYWDSARNAYLGDLYSVNFLENCDATNPSIETLQKQYEAIKSLTTKSHVMQYGDMSMTSQVYGLYIAYQEKSVFPAPSPAADGPTASSRDVVLHAKLHNYLNADESERETRLADVHAEFNLRKQHDTRIESVVREISGPHVQDVLNAREEINNWGCYKRAIAAYEDACGRFDDYSLQYTYVLANLCEYGVHDSIIGQAARNIC